MNWFIVILVAFYSHLSLCVPTPNETDHWKEVEWQILLNSFAHRHFYHSKEELELTKVVIIDAQPCNDWHPVSVFIHSASRSKGGFFDNRQMSRNTWVSDLKKLNISVYFVVALNPNQTINEEVRQESDRHKDIIQFGYIDDYYNLTLKTIAIFRWINRKCLTSTHILKTDDDVIVNSKLLLDQLSEFNTGISGVLSQITVIRNERCLYFLCLTTK